MERLLDRLFVESKTYLAPLQGSELDNDLEGSPVLLSPTSTDSFLVNLHLALNKAHPEAGAPYWRVRSWGLSCWQPIYLALLCVYRLNYIPSTLDRLHQFQQQAHIAGYALPRGEWLSTHPEAMIQYGASQLNVLFKAFLTSHIILFGGNRIFYKALLADQLMTALISIHSSKNTKQIQHEYALWAKSLDLPMIPLTKLIQTSEQISFVRQTCCLHFRRDDGEVCTNCPRQHKKSQENLCLN